MDRSKTKRIQQILVCVCIAAVVAFLAFMPMFAGQKPANSGSKASILSGTVQYGQIDTALIGGGVLKEEAPVAVTLPAAVKLTDFLLRNGDMVTKGTPIASVDRVTVMTAISQVQETLDHLAKQIEEAADGDGQETVTAQTGGTVKLLHAKEGDSVQSVMLEHGALAVLSLDNLLAVDLVTDSDIRTGKPMNVTLPDGKTVTGRVAKNLNGVMTVTVEDQGYALGDVVEVTTTNDVYLGSNGLYIYSPWNATAYTGTVESIHIRVGDSLRAGEALMSLENVGYTPTYRQLVDQRQEYEALMLELFQMYQTEELTAPCDGLLSGIDLDSPQLLSGGTSSGSTVRQEAGFELYALDTVQVAAVTPQTAMTLEIAVDELDVKALQVGMDARVMIEALGSEKRSAAITTIGNTGSNSGGSSKFAVELTLERTERMLAGMNATATVILATSDKVLTVPVKALVEEGTRTLIYTGYDAENEVLLDPVPVTTGRSDGENVEILEGLSEGQTYYYAYYDTLEISFTPEFSSGNSIFG